MGGTVGRPAIGGTARRPAIGGAARRPAIGGTARESGHIYNFLAVTKNAPRSRAGNQKLRKKAPQGPKNGAKEPQRNQNKSPHILPKNCDFQVECGETCFSSEPDLLPRDDYMITIRLPYGYYTVAILARRSGTSVSQGPRSFRTSSAQPPSGARPGVYLMVIM